MPCRKELQRCRPSLATSCSKQRVAETTLYAHRYTQLLSSETTMLVATPSSGTPGCVWSFRAWVWKLSRDSRRVDGLTRLRRRGLRRSRRVGGRRSCERSGSELARCRVAVVGIGGERPLDDLVPYGAELGSGCADERRRLGGAAEEAFGQCPAREGRRAGEQLEEDAAERVDIAAGVDLAHPDHRLGREVRGGAQKDSHVREPVAQLITREAEVGEVGVRMVEVRLEEDLGRGDAPVHEPGGVDRIECAGDL